MVKLIYFAKIAFLALQKAKKKKNLIIPKLIKPKPIFYNNAIIS